MPTVVDRTILVLQNVVMWVFLAALLWTFRMRQGSPYLMMDEGEENEHETGGRVGGRVDGWVGGRWSGGCFFRFFFVGREGGGGDVPIGWQACTQQPLMPFFAAPPCRAICPPPLQAAWRR